MPKFAKWILRVLYWGICSTSLFPLTAFLSIKVFEGTALRELLFMFAFSALVFGDMLLFWAKHSAPSPKASPHQITPLGELSEWYQLQMKYLLYFEGVIAVALILFVVFSELSASYIPDSIFTVFLVYCMRRYLSRAAAFFLCFGYTISAVFGLLIIFGIDALPMENHAEAQWYKITAITSLIGLALCAKPTQEVFAFHRARNTCTNMRNLSIVSLITIAYSAFAVVLLFAGVILPYEDTSNVPYDLYAFLETVLVYCIIALGCLRMLPGTRNLPVCYAGVSSRTKSNPQQTLNIE